ncbi:unnamed protein product [Lactuca saligna]|uniref:Transcription initiation factor TFIID subunit 1 histone acetyltransferase domain-containing protein n=1 Tax=Lactuca saligna TaxID=75948 RepID=A0AA35Z6A1_LACSI|nr:unnamed protein product [Lactuca saligna]
MDRIVWDPNQSVTKQKLLLDLQDEQMLFEILDNKDGDDLQLHVGAMITTRKDIAYFHRPKALWYTHENVVVLKEQGKLLTKGSMKIVLKSLGGKGSKLHISLRRIDRIYVVGQQEPHIEVMSPVSKGVQMYNMNRLLVFIYREFRTLQKRGLTPAICANELSAQFANVAEVSLRKRLKLFCDFQGILRTF